MVGYAQNSVENIEIDERHFSSIYALLLASLAFCDFSTVSFISQHPCSNFNWVFYLFCSYYYRLQNDRLLLKRIRSCPQHR